MNSENKIINYEEDLWELQCIKRALDSLEDRKIIRSKNLVGDLGEYYCRIFFNLKLNDQKNAMGYDAIGENEEIVEIKTRRCPKDIHTILFSKPSEFDILYYVELDEDFVPKQILRFEGDILREEHDENENIKISIGNLKKLAHTVEEFNK